MRGYDNERAVCKVDACYSAWPVYRGRAGWDDGIDQRSSEIPGLGSARTRTESKTERVISRIRIYGGDFIEQDFL